MNKKLQFLFRTILILISFSMAVNAQPMQVTDIPASSTDFRTIGDLVYFRVGDELWRTDGTAKGTYSLKSGMDRFAFYRFYEFNNMLFFPSVKHPDEYALSWKELWRSDGTPSGTVLIKASDDYDIAIAGSTGNYLYFGASEAMTGRELYRTSGAQASTTLVEDINTGPADGFIGISKASGDELFFAANDGEHGIELWKTNSTSSVTEMVKDINPGPDRGVYANGDESYFATDDRFYFVGYTSATGTEPWVSDGSATGTMLLKDVTPGTEGTGFVYYEIEHNGSLFFLTKPLIERWNEESAATDLWKTAGTSASTVKLKEVGYVSDEFGNPFRILNGNILFFAKSVDVSTGPHTLWRSDGTATGTQVVYNVQDYAAPPGILPFQDVVNDHLLFYADHDGGPTPFFRSDGTTQGTRIFTRFNSGYYLIYPRDVTRVGDLVFYGDHDGPSDHGYPQDPEDYYQLMQTDGFTTVSVRELFGQSLKGVVDITDYNGKALFTTYDESGGSTPKKLWIYDPASAPDPGSYFTLVNADIDEDISKLEEGEVYKKPAGTNINIRFNPAETPGSVLFQLNGKNVRIETAAPYSLAGDVNGDYAPWTGANPGTYKLTAIPYSEAGGKGTPGEAVTVNFTIESENVCSASGTILREYWDNVSGNDVSAIPVNTQPTSTSQLTIFEGPTNVDTNYGARIRGYICPPQTGEYTFWIASNDNSELWLSSDHFPDNKVRIASVTGATNPRQWDKYASQKSAPIILEAGKKYYVEALHKQGAGTDHVAVGWQLPSGTLERPISGARLSPFDPGDNQWPTISIIAPKNGWRYTAPADIVIETEASDADDGVAKVEFYQRRSDQSEMTLLGEDLTSPYTYLWMDIPAGSYVIQAVAYDGFGAKTSSQLVSFVVESGGCTASGTIMREVWTGVQGASVSDIPQGTPPDATETLTMFEGPVNAGTNYGARIRGYICPPMDGEYQFAISSNDDSELWLSTDDNPANKRLIASIRGATLPRQWDKYASQMSGAIPLKKGQRYYIEALHKQGIGTDNLAVGWRLPDARFEGPIPGSYLSPFTGGSTASAEMVSARSASDKLFEQVNIYPNPATGNDRELRIAGYEGIEDVIQTDVEIINMTGDVVFSERVSCGGDCSSYLLEINKQLVPGVYLINLKTNGARYSKRLLVK